MNQSCSLTCDAKSTGGKRIKATTANISGLKRHQKDKKADYCLLVAIGYEGQDITNSAISKESQEQRVTVMSVKNFISLLYLATSKQLGLRELRELFDTCHTPMQVSKWLQGLEQKEIQTLPYNTVLDIIYKFQSGDSELQHLH